MKSYNSLFPSYYYHEDDTAVFFESNLKFDWCCQIRSGEILRESSEINFQAITGSSELVNLLRRAKAVSNSFGRKKFEELRGKTNYYEGLGKGCYLNRSAMKLVNLDYVFSLIEPWSATYTTSSNLSKKKGFLDGHKLSERPHFSFVDLCGGPGGFIECIVLKCRHLGVAVTGFGMTLLIGDEEPGFRGIMKACNWNIFHLQDPPYSIILSDQKEDSSCGTQLNNDNSSQSNNIAIGGPNSFNLHPDNNIEESVSEQSKKDCECRVFLVGGATGTGDICAPENMHSLFSLMQLELPLAESPFVHTAYQTRRENCHLKNSPHQILELNSGVEEKCSTEKINGKKYVSFVCSDGFDHETEAFRIVLCQVIGMIKTLQVGGNFIMKVFSCTKIHTLKLFVLLSQLFRKMTLTKPVTSRPISGERFLVALGFLKISEKERQIIEDKLWKVCDVIKKWEDETVEKNKNRKGNESENMDKDKRDNESENGSGTGDKKNDKINKGEESVGSHLRIGIAAKKYNDNDGEDDGEGEVVVEAEVEEKGFGSYWPFQLSQIECDRATAYLSAINNSHIITQLISNLKILKLAEERGLQILDSNLISEIESVEIPLHDDDDNDGDVDDNSDSNDDDSDGDGDGDGYSSHDHRNLIGKAALPLSRSHEQGGSESVSSSVHGHSIVLSEGENTEEIVKGKEKEKNRVDEKMEGENSYSDDDDEDDEYDGDYYDFDDYGGYCQDTRLKSKKRKNRRRTACNKKRRMKKKIKYAEADSQEPRKEVDYVRIEEIEGEGKGSIRRRVSFNFNMDSEHEIQVPDPAHPEHEIQVPDPARPLSQMSSGELCNIDTIDNSGDDNNDGNRVKSNTSKIDPCSSSSISSSSCLMIEKQNTSLSPSLSEPNSEKLNGHSTTSSSHSHPAVHRTYIRDIVHVDERKKSIRVHEYYKLWRIYDLDVVY